MFLKKNRADKKEIAHIFSKGVFVNSNNITLKYLIQSKANNAHTIKHTSFIVPKSTAKSAVDRNLLRRRGYAVLANCIDHLPSGFLGVFIFNKKSMDFFGKKSKDRIKNKESIQYLENEIKNILTKIN